MENKMNQPAGKTGLLKESRLQLLKLHKLLVDIEREGFEKSNGQVTSGQFLNLLLNEQDFQWLRKFSTLIVEIDEMLDLDDGFSEEMIEKHLAAVKKIVNSNTSDEQFNDKFRQSLQFFPEVAAKNDEIKVLLTNE